MGLFDALRRKIDLYDEQEELPEVVAADESRAAEAVRKDDGSEGGSVRESEMPPDGDDEAIRYTARRMQVIRPLEFSEVTEVADYLKAGQTVVLNLEDMEEADARRMIDYVAGVLYVLNGRIEHPYPRTFLLAPTESDVTSEDVYALYREK